MCFSLSPVVHPILSYNPISLRWWGFSRWLECTSVAVIDILRGLHLGTRLLAAEISLILSIVSTLAVGWRCTVSWLRPDIRIVDCWAMSSPHSPASAIEWLSTGATSLASIVVTSRSVRNAAVGGRVGWRLTCTGRKVGRLRR